MGGVRVSVFLRHPVDLVKLTAEMARRGLWVAKVLPSESGFEIYSPEPGLVGVKLEGDEPSYKVYSSSDATSLTLFGDSDRFFAKLAEFVEFLRVGGCNEECIASAEMSFSEELSWSCSYGEIEVEGMGRLSLRGISALGEDEALSLAPLNASSSLMVYTVRGAWERVKGRAIALHSLRGKLEEVLKSWTCRE